MGINIEMDELVYIVSAIILAVLLLVSEILGTTPKYDANSITSLASSIISSASSSQNSLVSSTSSSSDNVPLGVIIVTK